MATLDFDPFFFAVGGATPERLERKRLLEFCLPKLRGRSFALAGSSYDSNGPFRIPSWIPSVLPASSASCSAQSLADSAVKLGERDALLVIGHIQDDEFRLFRAQNSELRDDNVWIMGGTPTAFNLKVAVGHCIDNAACPRYTLDQWEPTLAMYPEVLRKMRGFQWGGFFATRLPSLLRESEAGVVSGAFYRQFNLLQVAVDNKILEFERDVLKGAGNDERILRVLAQVDATVTASMKGVEVLTAIYKAYSDNGPWNDEATVSSLTSSLLKTMGAYTPHVEVNEYDSYVAHRMLRHYAKLEDDLTPDFHMRFVQYCLRIQNEEDFEDEQLDAYASHLRRGMAGRKIVVLHDLGLDPMSDDWLAVCMLMTVATRPKTIRTGSPAAAAAAK
eukprot:TRINITY_DN5579_c0_g2_i2.p1 TRINITY_DN5579_c0_g2~~TRINITY_DN5579_c0_g2_i2.p1  ORF type:complete len:400 (+),score=73.97 TRINITY_DN5579_c0_g2_i2:34-1200(+)